MKYWTKTLDKIVEIFGQPVETPESLELIDQYWIFTLAVEGPKKDASQTRENSTTTPAVIQPFRKRPGGRQVRVSKPSWKAPTH